MLTASPIQEIRQDLDYPDNFLLVYANGTTNEIIRRKIAFERERSPNSEYLLSHLESDYPEILDAIYEYEVSFNTLVDRELVVYRKAQKMLFDWGIEHNISWEVRQLGQLRDSPKSSKSP